MKHIRLTALIVLGLFLSQTAPAPVYMKLDDIKGEATAKGHEKWIEIESYSGGTVDASSPATTGRRTFEPIVFRKRIDKSSPSLARAHKEGTVYPVIQFEVEGRRCTLTNAKIVSIKPDQAMESISFNFTKIQWESATPERPTSPAAPAPKRTAPSQ